MLKLKDDLYKYANVKIPLDILALCYTNYDYIDIHP